MAGLVDAPAGSEDLHPVIRYYSFMFGDQKPFISEHVASGRLPLPSSLLIGFGVGAALTVLRVLLDFAFFKVSDFAFFKPLARKILGFPDRQRPSPNRALDVLSSNSKILSAEEVAGASASTGLSSEEVRDYMRVRRVSSLERVKLGKFKEAAWRLVVYVWLVAFGLKKSYGEPWFRDPSLVWDNWLTISHLEGLELYYHCAMGVYWHLIIFQFLEARRSDFWQMLVHHVATLCLLTFSWLSSLVRIGLLIMLCHDVSDIFLESAKLFNYAQKRFHWCHLAADVIFFTFAAVFGVSRLYIFPRYMVLNVWYTTALSTTPRLFFCSLLSTLLVLHVFWFYLILRMVYMFVFHGVEEDIRSDNEEEGQDPAGNESRSAAAGGHAQNGHSKAARDGKSPARGVGTRVKSKLT